MTIRTSDRNLVQSYIKKLALPSGDSHKGQNGKLLIIGGSSLFHASVLWAAEIASHFCDMVHFSSTKENDEIFIHLKEHFRNGIVIKNNDIDSYLKEDDATLVGPGMVRGDSSEAEYTAEIVKHILESKKNIVLDAGALQMMNPDWLRSSTAQVIITPHQKEFESLFGISISEKSLEEKKEMVKKYAREYSIVIILKAVVDIVSDGKEVFIIEGGNAGLTKGGSGDILAGLIASLYTKNDAMTSCILGSLLLKSAADELYKQKGYWYTMMELIEKITVFLAQNAL